MNAIHFKPLPARKTITPKKEFAYAADMKGRSIMTNIIIGIRTNDYGLRLTGIAGFMLCTPALLFFSRFKENKSAKPEAITHPATD